MNNIEDLQRYDLIDYDCFGMDADGDFVDYEEAKELFEKQQEQYENELQEKDALIVELMKDECKKCAHTFRYK